VEVPEQLVEMITMRLLLGSHGSILPLSSGADIGAKMKLS